MTRSFANFIAAVAAIVTVFSMMTLPTLPSVAGVVVLSLAFLAVIAILVSRWGDPKSRSARAVAFFVVLAGGMQLLFAPHFFAERTERRKLVTTIRDVATLREVTAAIEDHVARTGSFPSDLRLMLDQIHFPDYQLNSPVIDDDTRSVIFKVVDPDVGFFRLGDFIWVYTDLDPTDYAAHIVAFDVDLDRRGRAAVRGDGEWEIIPEAEFAAFIAEENRRRAERGLKPISQEVTKITAARS